MTVQIVGSEMCIRDRILGSGSDDPFTPAAFAHVAAQVKVADWNVIEIDEEVD